MQQRRRSRRSARQCAQSRSRPPHCSGVHGELPTLRAELDGTTYGLALEYAKGLALGLGALRLLTGAGPSGLVGVARFTMRGARGGRPTARR